MYIKCIIFFSSSGGAKRIQVMPALGILYQETRSGVGNRGDLSLCILSAEFFFTRGPWALQTFADNCRPLTLHFWDNPVTLFWVVEWLWRKWWQLLLVFPMPLVHVHSVVSRTQNNAERVFALMPEKNAHSYCTMIRGMVKVPSIIYFHLEGLLSWWFFSTLILTWLGDASDPECMCNVIWGWSQF